METTTEIDHNAVAKHYAERLQALYSDIQTWLGTEDYIFENGELELEQQFIGSYTAPTLTIVSKHTGERIAELKPVGALVIGASGRVDIIGDIDSDYLIYLVPDSTMPDEPTDKTGNTSERTYAKRMSIFPGFEEEGWYFREIRRLARVKCINKELFLDILAEVSYEESSARV